MSDTSNDWLGEALDLVRSRTSLVPRVGIILGSGLGGFAAEVEAEAALPYSKISGFPVSTAIGHKGQLTLGRFADCPVAVLEGRFHLYEGYFADQVVRPIQLLRALGVELLIVTNAAGGLNPGLRVGDVVVVEDHVNLMWTSPTVAAGRAKLPLRRDGGKTSADECGTVAFFTEKGRDLAKTKPIAGPLTSAPSPTAEFKQLCKSPVKEREEEQSCLAREELVSGTGSAGASPSRGFYDSELAEWAIEAARWAGASSSRGVYIGMTGPNYETRAEYRWLRQVGDLVGMSTVPEVLAARDLGLRVLALSVVSNECNPDALEPTDGAHVVAAVSRAEGRLRSIVRGVIGRFQNSFSRD